MNNFHASNDRKAFSSFPRWALLNNFKRERHKEVNHRISFCYSSFYAFEVIVLYATHALSNTAYFYSSVANSITLKAPSNLRLVESLIMRLIAAGRCSWFVIIYISTQKRAAGKQQTQSSSANKGFLRVYRHNHNNFADRMEKRLFSRNAFKQS